jgi:hypothetical protein
LQATGHDRETPLLAAPGAKIVTCMASAKKLAARSAASIAPMMSTRPSLL